MSSSKVWVLDPVKGQWDTEHPHKGTYDRKIKPMDIQVLNGLPGQDFSFQNFLTNRDEIQLNPRMRVATGPTVASRKQQQRPLQRPSVATNPRPTRVDQGPAMFTTARPKKLVMQPAQRMLTKPAPGPVVNRKPTHNSIIDRNTLIRQKVLKNTPVVISVPGNTKLPVDPSQVEIVRATQPAPAVVNHGMPMEAKSAQNITANQPPEKGKSNAGRNLLIGGGIALGLFALSEATGITNVTGLKTTKKAETGLSGTPGGKKTTKKKDRPKAVSVILQ